RAKRVPVACASGRPTLGGVTGNARVTTYGATIPPLLPVTQVGDDIRNGMRKLMRLRTRLVRRQSIEQLRRAEKHALSIEHAGQQTSVVNLVECVHPTIVF